MSRIIAQGSFNRLFVNCLTLGGEEYLTFGGCSVNSGGNMDPKSGIFCVPVTGL